ncbi:hypothetical protein L210DRAFT_3399567, partial [Boletus edulis BED1]
IDLDIARATAVDCDGTVGLHATDVVRVKEYVLTSPWTEHMLGCLFVVKVAGRAVTRDKSNDSSCPFFILGNDRQRLVEKDEVRATLGWSE